MTHESIMRAAEIIKSGGIVAFPTETVYGLGADATNESAVAKIFQLKKRPSFNPLIVHVANIEQMESIAEISADSYKLLQQFAPGPLTVVTNLKPNHGIAKSVLAGLNTIAIRIPDHRIAQELIRISERPIAAPSANPSGQISSTKHKHVSEYFANDDLFILDDTKSTRIGLESTIIDMTSDQPTILRYGFITPEAIEAVLCKKIATSFSHSNIKAPGMLAKHYSPNTLLRLNAKHLEVSEIGLNFGDSNLDSAFSLNLTESEDLIEAAQNLYDMLIRLDKYAISHSINKIAIAKIPNENLGLAINDRLARAAKQEV